VTHADQSDDPLDPALLQAAQEFHRPPDAVPTEAMWAAIGARRAQSQQRLQGAATATWWQRTVRPGRPGAMPRSSVIAWRPRWPRLGWAGVAAAAFLVWVGGMGGWWAHRRLGVDDPADSRGPASVATGATRRVPMRGIDGAYRVAVTRDLTQAEALLTTFRDDSRPSSRGESHSAEDDVQLASWARDLLTNTRLLLDSPAASDPERRRLLEDLELVLVQMVELGPDHRMPDRPMIDRTLDRDHVLTRLHNAVPVGSVGL
jgi:hypothetical protein